MQGVTMASMTAGTMPAAQRAYRTTKERILSGALPGGALLSEADIAAQLAVSRTPVHEAFLRLEAEELLRLIPRRGAVVIPVPPGEAADILDVRVALETAAVRRLAAAGQDLGGLIAALADTTRAQAEAGRARDIAGFARSDADFHHAIVTASGNAIADRFYATLADRQRRMTIGAIGMRPQLIEVLVREHQGLAGRIAERDPDGFQQALSQHLDATHSFLLGR
jgi:DNA-binding GntR family transcriptional regulator